MAGFVAVETFQFAFVCGGVVHLFVVLLPSVVLVVGFGQAGFNLVNGLCWGLSANWSVCIDDPCLSFLTAVRVFLMRLGLFSYTLVHRASVIMLMANAICSIPPLAGCWASLFDFVV